MQQPRPPLALVPAPMLTWLHHKPISLKDILARLKTSSHPGKRQRAARKARAASSNSGRSSCLAKSSRRAVPAGGERPCHHRRRGLSRGAGCAGAGQSVGLGCGATSWAGGQASRGVARLRAVRRGAAGCRRPGSAQAAGLGSGRGGRAGFALAQPGSRGRRPHPRPRRQRRGHSWATRSSAT